MERKQLSIVRLAKINDTHTYNMDISLRHHRSQVMTHKWARIKQHFTHIYRVSSNGGTAKPPRRNVGYR